MHENQHEMTTKRSRLRKGASGLGKTIAKTSNTRAARKEATAKRMKIAEAAAAPAPVAKAKPAKKAAAKKTATKK